MSLKPRFFKSPAEFRKWLEKNHDKEAELSVGFYKKTTGKPSITWREAVDEALCFGWIDGVRHSLDGDSYTNRFTPRRPRSNWSAVNVARVKELIAEGRMQPAGLEAYAARTAARTGIYSYERAQVTLDKTFEKRLRADKEAWTFYKNQPAGYQRAVTWWIMTAKRQETRERRLETLIECSRNGRTVPPLTRPTRK